MQIGDTTSSYIPQAISGKAAQKGKAFSAFFTLVFRHSSCQHLLIATALAKIAQVENQSVVVSFLCQLEEILRRFRRVQVIQFQLYLSERGVEENSGRAGRVVLRVQSRGVLLLFAAHDGGVSLLNVVVVVVSLSVLVLGAF